MTLTLAIGNAARLDNGAPGELVLHRRGAIVGRAPTCDWPLPDPAKHISSRHCEIAFDGQHYVLTDTSTNGTFLNGAATRLSAPHRIAQGDRFQVGPFVLTATLTGDAATAPPAAPAPAVHDGGQGWGGWHDEAPTAAPPPSDWQSPAPTNGWDARPAPPPVHSGGDWEPAVGPSLARPEAHRASASIQRPIEPSQAGWAPPTAPAPAPDASTWDTPTPAPDPASGWSSAAPDRPAPPSPDDVWGRLAEGNVVDWARGGFGQPVEPPRDPLGLAPPPAKASLPSERPPVPPPADAAAAPSPELARSAGDTEADARANGLLRKLVAGLVVMVEARARAKAQLGAESTAFNPAGHNPLKFARTPDEALAMLVEPPQRGFMEAERAVEDAFQELQSHQMATLRAMQGALRATLDRFSPTAIRARADAGGVLERILPAARDAALWQAYEREFGGVAQGSDEAFMDVFAKEFRKAYNEQARRNG